MEDKAKLFNGHKDSSGNWVDRYFYCPCQTVDEQMECLYFAPLQKGSDMFLCGNLDGDICKRR